jgi:hypothetical protein
MITFLVVGSLVLLAVVTAGVVAIPALVGIGVALATCAVVFSLVWFVFRVVGGVIVGAAGILVALLVLPLAVLAMFGVVASVIAAIVPVLVPFAVIALLVWAINRSNRRAAAPPSAPRGAG